MKRERVSERGFDCLGGHAGDPIEISDSEAEEGIRHSEKKRFLVQKESKREEGKGCPVFVDKVENFGNDDYSCVPENRVSLPDEKEHCVDKSGSNDDGLILFCF